MRTTALLVGAIAIVFCGAAFATAPNAMLDFEEYYGSGGVIVDDITPPGTFPWVTFSSGGNAIYTSATPDPTHGGNVAVLPSPYVNGYRADFTIGGVDLVTVDLGDYDADIDNIFLKAYDAKGNLLQQDSSVIPDWSYDYTTLQVTKEEDQPFFAYVVFGSTGSYPNSIYADNFGVHAPGAPAIALIGLAPLARAWARRRRL
jgi:hypothetical protein